MIQQFILIFFRIFATDKEYIKIWEREEYYL